MVYTINNTEYVLINVPVVDAHRKRFDKTMKRFECIVQDFEIMQNNLTILNFIFGTTKVKVSVLVPSKHIKEFQEEFFK